jgi:hypothetical protein
LNTDATRRTQYANLGRARAGWLAIILVASGDYGNNDGYCGRANYSEAYLRSRRKIVALDSPYLGLGNRSGRPCLGISNDKVIFCNFGDVA